jgi:predicted GNAT family acetyltransferase
MPLMYKIDMENKHIIHNQEKRSFELHVDGDKATLMYNAVKPSVWSLNHTYVPGHLEGQGIGSELVKHVLAHCQNNNISIIPRCPFIDAYIRRHPGWENLVYGDNISTG